MVVSLVELQEKLQELVTFLKRETHSRNIIHRHNKKQSNFIRFILFGSINTLMGLYLNTN